MVAYIQSHPGALKKTGLVGDMLHQLLQKDRPFAFAQGYQKTFTNAFNLHLEMFFAYHLSTLSNSNYYSTSVPAARTNFTWFLEKGYYGAGTPPAD
jgi:hypothetical protein